MELAAELLRAPVWEQKWDPVWLLNLLIFVQRAAKRDIWPSQEGKGGEKKGVQKWTPKKSMNNRLDVENGPAADPTPRGSEAMGKDIGRGKPFPME